jgi:hypothetical protein
VSGLEQSGLEALTTPPRTPAIELAVERTFMFRGGAGAMTVSPNQENALTKTQRHKEHKEKQIIEGVAPSTAR